MATPPQLSGLNAGYVGFLLEQYLENPEAVDPAWRELFEGADDALLTALPVLDRLATRVSADDGNGAAALAAAPVAPRTPSVAAPAAPPPPAVEAPPSTPAPPPAPIPSAAPTAVRPVATTEAPLQQVVTSVAADLVLLPAVASAMALVDAIRSHGHLAARLDPLGSEPPGDPALDESELTVPLPPEVQAQIPASLLGVHVDGETLADVLPRLREVYCGTIAYEIEHLSD
ncbi:MAG: 2-oxoglutarate dehydrogenase E1 subunit family protein, partial [Gaiellaceae bacterium]